MLRQLLASFASLIQSMTSSGGAIPVLLGIAGASALVAITWQISDSIHQGNIEQLSAQHAIQLADSTNSIESINQSIAATATAISALSSIVHGLRASIGNTSLARVAEVKEINRMHEDAFKALHQYVATNQKYFNNPNTITTNLTIEFDHYKMASDAMVVQYKKYFATFAKAIGELEHALLMGTESMSRELQAAVSQLQRIRDSRPQVPAGIHVTITPVNDARGHQLEQRIKTCKTQIDRLSELKKELEDIKNRQQLAAPDQE